MSSEEKHHIVSYKTYLFILLGLITLTLLSVGITNIELREYTVAAALIFAAIKSYFVLYYFMHLKYDKPLYRRMAMFVFLLFFAVLFVTFIDYVNR
ncbi:MAG: cytochrome C oxidase subunit IV family protein [Prolixibacteraceae bacterium]|jgi:cytochrome c oxidase subunit 4|nr:cytochrome C oxidase subunit IV family protein [Prolixibacteraceae bacterium]